MTGLFDLTPLTLVFAFIGGLLPSLVWLYFLLKEDSRCPEPKHIIALAFVAGMGAVPLALPLEQVSCSLLALSDLGRCTTADFNINLMATWAMIEETLKYVMAALFILWRRQVDEAPDYVIYMITTALGFAAAENMLFLVDPLSGGHLAAGLMTTNLRFLGSTLLHVVASAILGLTFAFTGHYAPITRTLAAATGLILAIALHTAFNALIMSQGTSSALIAFFMVWVVTVIVLAAFEVLKYFQYSDRAANTC